MTLGGIDHVWFWTTDMDRAVAFYRDVVGLRLTRRDGDAWAEFDGGDVRLALHGTVEDHPSPHGGTVVFWVDDLDAERLLLEGRGVTFAHVGEAPGYARFASFTDPDGNDVQIIEYLEGGG